jgi:hypothetical protein
VKLALALGLCALMPWFVARAPGADPEGAHARIVDARTLEVVQGNDSSVLTLSDLPDGARLHAVAASRLMESGTVVALVVELAQGFEYRYLCRREARAWGTHAVSGRSEESDGWWTSVPLFQADGGAYRIVEVHPSQSDAFELTFRRGWPLRGNEPRLDEVLVVDSCPGNFGGDRLPPSVTVLRAEARRL